MRAALLIVGATLAIVGCSNTEQLNIPSPSGPTPSTLEAFTTQQIQWSECGKLECGSIRVPRNYDDPAGPTTTIALARTTATKERLGSLVINPGGPGGSGIQYVHAAESVISPAVRERYDIVGMDPRGVGQSDPVDCITDAQLDEAFAMDPTPETETEINAQIMLAENIKDQCAKSEQANAMNTENTARDLDIVRAVLDGPDAPLNYLGKSYGTKLGATYAELFGANVGRMVLDGVLPRTMPWEDIALTQSESLEAVLDQFLADCAKQEPCTFKTREDLSAWLDGLDAKPIEGERPLTEGLARTAILNYLYFPKSDWPKLRDALAEATDGKTDALIALADSRVDRGTDGKYLSNTVDAYYAVMCNDYALTGGVQHIKELAKQWQTRAPFFGESVAWGLLPCDGWTTAANPTSQTPSAELPTILIVSNTNDPATPLSFGEALNQELPNSTLLTWNATNHTAYREGSTCIDQAVDDYLVDGVTPKPGTTCGP